jgi:hypothetical protein
MDREHDLSERLTSLLGRRTPPRGFAGNESALREEFHALLRIITRFAPKTDWADWWRRFDDRVNAAVRTRAWPVAAEVEDACRAVAQELLADGSAEIVEAAAVDRMAAWFAKFRDQMPGHGRPSRTRELIRRGVLRDLREARFYGFDLSPADEREALSMALHPAERQHHEAVLDGLRATNARLAALGAAQKPVPPQTWGEA